MRKLKVLLFVLAVMVSFGVPVYAATTDIVQAPTGYFVPTDAQKYDWPYYRWYGDDWSWKHGAIAESITSASLSISAWDVDYESGERDEIYLYDNANTTWVKIGVLTGENDAWSYGSSFVLGSEWYDDIALGLQVKIMIDVATHGNWAVTLGKSALEVNGGVIPDPEPGAAVPEPATMLLLGLGLAGVAVARKKFQR